MKWSTVAVLIQLLFGKAAKEGLSVKAKVSIPLKSTKWAKVPCQAKQVQLLGAAEGASDIG